MTFHSLLQIFLYLGVLLICVKPLGLYMAKVYKGECTFLTPVLLPVEKAFYSLSGLNPHTPMNWRHYATAVLGISLGGFILLFSMLMMQGFLPLNPLNLPSLTPDLAFNTAVSFVTNTNWQSYGGESTMSFFSQMVGLTVQNFISAAVGMAVLMAFIRGLVGRQTTELGNFWADMVRGVLYVLMPLSIVWALLLGSQGVVQTFTSQTNVSVLEQQITSEQTSQQQSVALGPVASQVAIKQLGTNGGGFYNANSAHPFENPTPFSNFLEMMAILLIPTALCYTFGIMVGDRRQGWAVFGAMTVIFIPLMMAGIIAEQAGNPKLTPLGVDQTISTLQSGGNMEGKEVRFGITNSMLFSSVTTAASNGSVNAMHDSYTPLGGLIPLILIQFGEVIFGGVGSGLYGMLTFVIITVFLCGLMVGRTPEYLGKKIGAFEMKMASLIILIPCCTVLIGTALAVMLPAGQAGILNTGSQGFSEILYAVSSASNNNGSAFAGLSANTPFYNTLLGLCMLIGRFWVIVPVLAMAGALAIKKTVPVSSGTLPTHTVLFVMVLASIVVLVGVLTFVPALALGPVAEYFHLIKG